MMKRYKKAAAAAAIVLVLGLALSFPAVRTALAEALSVFRVNSMQIININPQDIQALEDAFRQGTGSIDIESFGQVEVEGKQERTAVSIAEAQQAVDFSLRMPDLAGYGLDLDSVYLETGCTVTMTLSVENINKGLEVLGGNIKLPEQLEGQSFSIVVPARVDAEYTDGERNLSITQFSNPEIKVPADVDMEALRDTLLGIPVLPDHLRQQLLAVDPLNTLLIPNIDGTARGININGTDGVLLQNEDMAADGLALLWQQDGVFNLIIGNGFELAETLAIAAQMK